MSILFKFAAAALIFCLCASGLHASSNADLFNQRVLPVLEKNCGKCHMVANPAGGLSVSNLDALLAGGKHGPAIAPGDAKGSLLLQYLRGEKTPKMPMGGSLSDDAIASLAKSIDEMQPTAKTARKRDPHLEWLLHKPAAPAVPTVKDATWVRNPIDAFVLAKLEAKGLKPAPPASKRAWLRRVYFDLIG